MKEIGAKWLIDMADYINNKSRLLAVVTETSTKTRGLAGSLRTVVPI